MARPKQAPRGALLQAEKVLANPAASNPTELRNALALVHGSGAYSPSELAARYGASPYFEVRETGKIALAQTTTPVKTAETWTDRARRAQDKQREARVVFNQKWQDWRILGADIRSMAGITAEMRNEKSPAKVTQLIIGQTMVRQALVTAMQYGGRSDPHEQYAKADELLQTKAVMRALDREEKGTFQRTLDPAESDEYSVANREDMSFVRVSRALGSFTREVVAVNNHAKARIVTTQSVDVARRTTFAVDPEWRDMLFESESYTPDFQPVGQEASETLGAFIADSDAALVPLESELQVSQQFHVMQGRAF